MPYPTNGPWSLSYGEIWVGGDLAVVSESEQRIIATVVHHEDNATDTDVANAIILAAAIDMLGTLESITRNGPTADNMHEATTLVARINKEIYNP